RARSRSRLPGGVAARARARRGRRAGAPDPEAPRRTAHPHPAPRSARGPIAMLWAGLHFPLLPLEAIVRGDPGLEPLAVAAGESRPRLIALNVRAWRAGVRPGMAVAGAL